MAAPYHNDRGQSAGSDYYSTSANYPLSRPTMPIRSETGGTFASTASSSNEGRPHLKAYEEEYADPKHPYQSAYAPAYSGNAGDGVLLYPLSNRNEETERFVPGSRDGAPIPERRPIWRRYPVWCWLMSVIQIAVFIGQLGHAWKLTGSPIQLKPTFNPLIGPSVYNSINMGARYPLCMHAVRNVTDVVTAWPCPNNTASVLTAANACSLAQLCGHGAVQGVQPHQWWRFITPIFLHGGLLHIAFNLLLQLRLGPEIELLIGTPIFALIYLVAGVGGFLFGGNFAGDGVASQGASGALFSIISLSLLDLLYHWQDIQKPVQGLLMLILEIVFAFVLGLLPGVDNFSHIGGFLFGLLMGIALMRSPNKLKRRIGGNEAQRMPISTKEIGGVFQQRSSTWWAWNGLRCACLVLVVTVYILLVQNFYKDEPTKCTWCKYLSCIPVSNWCSVGDIQTQVVL